MILTFSLQFSTQDSNEFEFNGFVINLREKYGFINATQMCSIFKKQFKDWSRLDSSKELILALDKAIIAERHISLSLIDVKKVDTH